MTEDDNNIFYAGILTGLKCSEKLYLASNDETDEFFFGIKGAIKIFEIALGINDNDDLDKNK